MRATGRKADLLGGKLKRKRGRLREARTCCDCEGLDERPANGCSQTKMVATGGLSQSQYRSVEGGGDWKRRVEERLMGPGMDGFGVLFCAIKELSAGSRALL